MVKIKYTFQEKFSCPCLRQLFEINFLKFLERDHRSWINVQLKRKIHFSTFFDFSKINKKLAPKLLICLSTSLLILLVIFVVGAEKKSNYHVCQLMAVLLHYFTLSTFCWMACEGFNLYRNFINIFKRTRNENGILARMSLFSWGKKQTQHFFFQRPSDVQITLN